MSKGTSRHRSRQITKKKKRAHKLRKMSGMYNAATGKIDKDKIMEKIHVIAPFYEVAKPHEPR